MDDQTLFKLLGISMFLIFLFILAYYVARNGKIGAGYKSYKKHARINVLETKSLDPKTNLYLISIDRNEYMILTGATGESITPYKMHIENQTSPLSVPSFGLSIVPGDER